VPLSHSPRRLALHLGLFALTVAVIILWWLPDWQGGLIYAAALSAILLAHEFGHYFAAKRHHVDVTLPYFLPGLPPFYTFGAFIKMRASYLDRKALLCIGAAGPLAGAAVALPIYVVGLSLSEVHEIPPLTSTAELLVFGDSLFTWLTAYLLFDPLPRDHDIFLHPLAYAGWVGFFVTALNLTPAGQLDGGHIGFAVFGRAYRYAARACFAVIILLGLLLHPVWLVLAIFLIVTGIDHPEVDDTPPPPWAYGIGAACLLLFAFAFVPRPIVLPLLHELLSAVF